MGRARRVTFVDTVRKKQQLLRQQQYNRLFGEITGVIFPFRCYYYYQHWVQQGHANSLQSTSNDTTTTSIGCNRDTPLPCSPPPTTQTSDHNRWSRKMESFR
jgi:hypothetical protein